MFLIDTLILLTGVLLLLGIASSKFSARLGVPALVLFVALGMLAGSEGIGGIEFENYALAHGIGTLALAVILFDGGLRTPLRAIRSVWKPSLLLATLGVLITAAITGGAVALIFGVPLLRGMLLGSIVGSTDAAAVFAVLRSGGVHLPRRISSTLELESGSNDPMAIFLTIGLIQVITGEMPFGVGLLTLFFVQMAGGLLVGLTLGFATVWMINRINLDAAGLYPLLVSAGGLLAFGLAVSLGGSGFLAAYIAGIVIGNKQIVFQRGVFLFHDALAWLSQIIMFAVLGLLSLPSRLLDAAGAGLLIAAVLIFISRPVAIALTLLPFRFLGREFRFNWREQLFLTWGGLKGAVPITLATFPLMFGVPGAQFLFDVVFFVVLVSALVQGWSIPWVARRLGLETPTKAPSPVTLEISSLRHVEGDIVDYLVDENSPAAGRQVKALALPQGVVIAIIARGEQIIPPQGGTRIEVGDHVILVLRPGTRPLVDKVFAPESDDRAKLPADLEFPLRGTITVGELEEFYGIQLDAPSQHTLSEALRARLGPDAAPGARADYGPVALIVRDLDDDHAITHVGMVILPQAKDASPPPPESAGTANKQG
jgi:cell volume regulation protein A